ncbi:IS630 family transposase [Corallococcus aberystwythensis]|uniref:IS630 family transposase n=1 Tax=Corallococcus aberystwythensis TaxID=2316722 RepID=UPI0013155066|nr:IS630 family transposase [Corallococcus aberystwythensis]
MDDAVRERLRDIGRSADVDADERDRVQMVLLAAEGWSAPRIARHLGVSDKTVRRLLKGWRMQGEQALYKKLPGPTPDFEHQQRVQQALHGLLEAPRAWSAGQLSGALEAHGIHLGPRQVRRYLATMGAGWRRTKMSLTHKQKPDAVSQARARLLRLKKSREGKLDLYFLDECGFSPTQPTGYSWAAGGTRKLVPYENPQRRRVNALVAYRPSGDKPGLRFLVRPRTLMAHDVVRLLRRLPSGLCPCVVVLDNVGIHVAHQVQNAAHALSRQGLRLFYLPAYSPQLNDVEAGLQVVNHYELPERSYATLDDLLRAVRRALRRHHLRLRFPGQHLCPGA